MTHFARLNVQETTVKPRVWRMTAARPVKVSSARRCLIQNPALLDSHSALGITVKPTAAV